MLLPEQVKPLIGHEDRHVRRAAARYFTEARSTDPDVLPLILDAAERFADDYPLAWGDQVAVAGPALDRVLDHLGRTNDEEGIARYNRIIAAAPGDVLAPRRAGVLGHPKLDPASARAVELRCDLDAATGATLWDDLQRCCREADAAPDMDGVDFVRIHALVDALSRRDFPDDATVIRLIRDLEPEEGWLEVALVELAGRRRLVGALPNLVAKYQYLDADLLIEATSDAIARINDPEAARLIQAQYRAEADHWRVAVGWHLGHIKHPDVESVVLDLLETEPDATARTLLCTALCDLFSERGIPAVEREIERGYDTTIDRLEDHLLVLAEVHGVPLPRADAWREARANEEARRAKLQALWQQGQERAERLEARGIDPTDRSFPEAGPLSIAAAPGSGLAPIRIADERVGRNDPCPCGSGKKFKKCCGKSA